MGQINNPMFVSYKISSRMPQHNFWSYLLVTVTPLNWQLRVFVYTHVFVCNNNSSSLVRPSIGVTLYIDLKFPAKLSFKELFKLKSDGTWLKHPALTN